MAENKINQAELDEKQLNEVNGGYNPALDQPRTLGEFNQYLEYRKQLHPKGERRKS